MDWGDEFSLMAGDKKIKKRGHHVDPDFLVMFSFPLVKGNAATALNDLNSMIITESVANALFGKEEAIGKTIRLNNDYSMQVSAVIKDVPKNSSIQFDFLAPYEYLVSNDDFIKNQKTNWGNNFLINRRCEVTRFRAARRPDSPATSGMTRWLDFSCF